MLSNEQIKAQNYTFCIVFNIFFSRIIEIRNHFRYRLLISDIGNIKKWRFYLNFANFNRFFIEKNLKNRYIYYIINNNYI